MKKRFSLVGLGTIGLLTVASTGLMATETTTTGIVGAGEAICYALGATGTISQDTAGKVSSCGADFQGWTNFVKGGALIGTIYFGYKGSGLEEGSEVNLKKLAMAGMLAAVALQYSKLVTTIASLAG